MSTKNLPINRHALLSNRAKLWCSDCQALRVVADFFNGPDEAKLALCGHRRKMEAGKSVRSVASYTEAAA
jgi:hypothetical protein